MTETFQKFSKNLQRCGTEWGTITTRYIWQDQLRIAAELNANGTFKKQFIYADSVNSPEYMFYNGKKYLFVKDHRGSILQVVDSSTGEVMQQMKYSEFGEVLLDTNPGFQTFGFAGGLYDYDTKLVRFGARDYDGSTGRWLSKDPIRFNGGDTNLFGYVMQDPINHSDPYGLWRWPGDIYDEAVEETERRYPDGGHNDEADAFRHCMATCTMTQENGFAAGWATGEANELRGDLHGQPSCEKEMDRNNNAFGSYLGQSQGSCADRCGSAASGGLLMTLK